MGTEEIEGRLYCLVIFVVKQTAVGGNIYECMLIFSMIRTSEEDIMVQELPGFGEGTSSAI